MFQYLVVGISGKQDCYFIRADRGPKEPLLIRNIVIDNGHIVSSIVNSWSGELTKVEVEGLKLSV